MKLDQETLAKHQFWFLLGGYFLIWLIAVMWMWFTYPGEIARLQDAYKKASDGVKSAQSSGPVNTATFVPPWEEEAKRFSAHKGVIWEKAWVYQSGMYDWPPEWIKKYNGMTNLQVSISPDDRAEYKEKLYPEQIKTLRTYAPKWLYPVEFKDGFDNVFNPKTDWKETPTREEIWLAQEDYWVKRELLVVVYDAMARQALMQPVPIDEKKEPMPKGVEARYRYRNKNWEITLNIRKNDKGQPVIGGDSTIKNIHPSRHPQALTSAKGRGIWFNVAQDNVRTLFEVRGEPVVWNETKKFSEENYPDPLSGIKWDKEWVKDHLILVSQGFDQTNCPIRRINAIELAKQDCRTFIWPLQPNHILAALDALPEDEQNKNAATGGGGGMPSGGMPSGSGPPMMPGGNVPGGGSSMMMQMMGKGGTMPSGNKTPNNEIERDRYLHPKDLDKKINLPSRHLPLALQLIVEQTHINDVLLALANSRLRLQITQVEFTHAKDYVPQSEQDKDKKDGTDTTGPRVFMAGMPGASMAGGATPEQIRMQMEMRMRMQQQQRDPQQTMQMQQMQMQRQMQMQMQRQMQMQQGMTTLPPSPSVVMSRSPTRPAYLSAPSGTQPGANQSMLVGADAKQSAANSPDDNLVELTVYGIATLYRAPDAPQSTEQQAGQAGTAVPQPGQQQPAAAATPSSATPSPAPATPTAAPATPSSSATPPPAKQPNEKPAEQQKAAPPAAKQPETPVDQQKAPPPPPPPAGNKKS
jgi:hypothetical protein